MAQVKPSFGQTSRLISNKMKKILFLILSFLGVAGAYADFSVQLDAGRLRTDSSVPLPHIDNMSPANGGSLLLLVAANGDGAFENNLVAGSYVAGNDLILAAGGFDTSGGQMKQSPSSTFRLLA